MNKMEARGLDPFLIAHRVGHGEFDMAGKYSPAAVRDQMNRAVAIVERAWLVGLLHDSSKLLIKGCGAAGVSAAMQAVKLGVGSVTIAADGPFFDRQRRSHRIIDPVEYDWPAEGWDQGDSPPNRARVPLPYERGRAKKIVATMWIPAWDAFRRVHGGKQLHVVNAAATPTDVDRILDCTGPGSERTEVAPSYRWFPFWDNDPLELPNLGFEKDPRPRDVLISGAGDGALQDFLRVLFPGGQSPRDLYLALGLSRVTRLELEWRILNAEDRARRAWVWSADPGIDCGILTELHDSHRAAPRGCCPRCRTA